MKIKALKGFKDIVPGETEVWQYLEDVARDIFARFDFSEIRMPILEETELFARSIGEATDIVEKEMYTFSDKQITMRPEATASLLRAYIEHGLYLKKPVQRLFTIGPMFRHERPQKGRLRQFHQLDLEVLGSESPLVDAELMALGSLFFKELQIEVSLEINSLGCPECRPGYRQLLVSFIEERLGHLCSDCQRRSKTNPLRVLDCKVEACREQLLLAPSIQDHLCQPCREHFTMVKQGLDGLGVDYSLNKFMVRGLDYYCRTTFEFLTRDLGSQAAVAAGGRYDGLIETLGGPKNCPGIGFAMGMERIVLLLAQGELQRDLQPPDLFMVALGEEAMLAGFTLTQRLRAMGAKIAMGYESKSLKSQMKQANKSGAPYALIVGADELAKGIGLLRTMHDNAIPQQEVLLSPESIASAITNK